MSKSQEQIPEVLFSYNELAAIDRLLRGYDYYIQKSPVLAKNVQWVASLEQIRERLAVQLASGNVNGVQVFLNVKDMQQLREAMHAFVVLVKRVFPQNEERQRVIESVNLWRLRLKGIIAECEV